MAETQDIIDFLSSPTTKDVVLITKAYEFAKRAHLGAVRLSGEPYFLHLTETAKNLGELGMGSTTIAAGLLHDTIEDAQIDREEIKKEFGSEILFLVEGVTKLGKLKYRGTDRHNESLRKLFVAMSEDIRVLIIKLADRLHNMKTLSHVSKDKQRRIATETLEIYAPIAYRLGIRKLNRDLEDLAFPYVYPKEYEEIKNTLKIKKDENTESLEKFLKSVKKALAKDNLINVKTEYRVKGLYSLYKKLERKNLDLEKVYDILALRIIVPDINDCYKALGIVHSYWRPLPGKIKDYIAFPKPNGYKALHTTVFTGDGNVVEVQIKTEEMQLNSEFGIASHISYKEGGKSSSGNAYFWIKELLPIKQNFNTDGEDTPTDTPEWIKELVEYQDTNKDYTEFKNDLKSDFFSQRIFVFTPTGDVVDLPIGSCPIDFAYSIHSDIGDHTFGTKINGKMVSLNEKLKNGDIVEVLTRESSKPNQKWLEYVKTAGAKKNIRQYIQNSKRK